MKFNWLAKIGISIFIILLCAYLLFLIAPLFLNPIANNYKSSITKEIDKATGLVSQINNIKIVTTPKLSAGVKIDNFSITTPNSEPLFSANDFQIKMSLLPLLRKQVEVDSIKLANLKLDLKINKDGSLFIEKYFPNNTISKKEENTKQVEEKNVEPVVLPIRLSNNLPDIKIGGYNILITDGIDNYSINGNSTEITNFVFNKSVKVKASGKITLKNSENFNYNIKIFNKLMPNVDLHEIVFNPPTSQNNVQQTSAPINFNIIEMLEKICLNKLMANLDVDLKLEQNNINGNANISNLSILGLPKSYVNTKFEGHNIYIDSNIYTAQNEVSKLNGKIKHGKKPNIDLNFISDVELANVLIIVKEVARIFNINDLQTLTANGKLKSNFNIKSDMKNIQSNGFLKLPSANIYYGLYQIGIDNINADVILDNNNININNVGFMVYNQPLSLYGKITEKAESDLHLIADKLSLKGLLVAFGQAALLKENNINSGTISAKVDINGKLDKINPIVKIGIDDINIKNIPMDVVLKAPSTLVNITSDGKSFTGNFNSKNISAINPMAKINIPSISANINPECIEITQTPVKIENINTTISGKIKNYLTEKISLDFVTTNDIKSILKGDLNLYKQVLNLNYSTTELSTIVVPMFDKSKMTFAGNINIIGNMLNPKLNGMVNIPQLDIPEIPVTMTNTNVKLDGTILHGKGSVENFKTGGIEANNLTADIVLNGENLYIKNLIGNAFDGKIKGNIIYNVTNAKTNIDFSGEGLDAEKAVYGAAGIKNALNGTLGFNTKLTLTVLDYNDMIRSMRGNLKFSVKNGSFLSIGRLDNFFKASNIVNNVLLKNTVGAISETIGLTETAKFDYLDGNLDFDNGWAILSPIKSSGKALAYYVTGKFNLINFSTNVNILGRLDAPIVAKLGPIGELSTDKLLSYIPVFGNMTSKFVDTMTTNPKGENVAAIPSLTNGSTNYKDFKVIFNGGLESSNSIKSFKWLSDVDTSAIDTQPDMKESLNVIKNTVEKDLTTTIDTVKNSINIQKEEWNATKEQLKNSGEELKNLFKSFK